MQFIGPSPGLGAPISKPEQNLSKNNLFGRNTGGGWGCVAGRDEVNKGVLTNHCGQLELHTPGTL